jgi:two-component system, OmpR family, heavy metal sensor histidine kinase CusS
MKRMFSGTRAKLTLIHAAVLAVAILLADIALYLALATGESGAADQVLRSQAATIASGIEDVNGQVRFGGGDLPTETQQGIAVDAAIINRDGSISQTPAQPLSSSTLTDLAASARRQGSPLTINERDSRGVARRVYVERLQVGQGGDAVLVVSRSIAELDANLARTALLLGVFSLLIVIGGAVLAHWLTGRVLLPVRRIAAMARSLSQDDLHRRVDLAVPNDELGELVETFNGMLARLEASFESLRRFTADASHELRSPLTFMRSELEGTRARPRTPEEYERVLDEMETEVEHMSRLVDRLLILARADAGALRPARVPVDAADFLQEAGARWSATAERSGTHIEVESPELGTIAADPDLLRRILDNLLENAIRHAPPDSVVRVTGAREAGSLRVDVSDQGPGIPAAFRERIFDRFARLDGARARDAGGAGLGLALSRAIAKSHGGSLELVSRDGGGATFRLLLPLPASGRLAAVQAKTAH